jgi:RNHCP domain
VLFGCVMKMVARNERFECGNCGRQVDLVRYGGSYRNHCPHCLFSRHVDSDVPGDRASLCGGLMAPIGVFTRKGGEYVIVHRCQKCGLERFNRIAGDDDFDLVTSLSTVPMRKGM